MGKKPLHPAGKMTRSSHRLPPTTSVRPLARVISICSYCRKFRGDDDNWYPLSLLDSDLSHLRTSHGICPACAEALYPDLYEAVTAKRAVF